MTQVIVTIVTIVAAVAAVAVVAAGRLPGGSVLGRAVSSSFLRDTSPMATIKLIGMGGTPGIIRRARWPGQFGKEIDVLVAVDWSRGTARPPLIKTP